MITTTWTDPCLVCGAPVETVTAEPITVRDNPEALLTVTSPACPALTDPDADCTCLVIVNPDPPPERDVVFVVGARYTLEPCGHQADRVRVSQRTAPAPGTFGELLAWWAETSD